MSFRETAWLVCLYAVLAVAWATVVYEIAALAGWKTATVFTLIVFWGACMLNLIITDLIASLRERRARRNEKR